MSAWYFVVVARRAYMLGFSAINMYARRAKQSALRRRLRTWQHYALIAAYVQSQRHIRAQQALGAAVQMAACVWNWRVNAKIVSGLLCRAEECSRLVVQQYEIKKSRDLISAVEATTRGCESWLSEAEFQLEQNSVGLESRMDKAAKSLSPVKTQVKSQLVSVPCG